MEMETAASRPSRSCGKDILADELAGTFEGVAVVVDEFDADADEDADAGAVLFELEAELDAVELVGSVANTMLSVHSALFGP